MNRTALIIVLTVLLIISCGLTWYIYKRKTVYESAAMTHLVMISTRDLDQAIGTYGNFKDGKDIDRVLQGEIDSQIVSCYMTLGKNDLMGNVKDMAEAQLRRAAELRKNYPFTLNDDASEARKKIHKYAVEILSFYQ